MIRETLVIERGQCHQILIMTEFWTWYASFGCGNLRSELVATILSLAYIFLFVENELYKSESSSLWPSVIRFFVSTIYVVFNQTVVGAIITQWGKVYIDAKIPYESSLQLLNNMKEGVIISDKSSGLIHFQNVAAK